MQFFGVSSRSIGLMLLHSVIFFGLGGKSEHTCVRDVFCYRSTCSWPQTKTSSVWPFFEEVEGEDGNVYLKCKLCMLPKYLKRSRDSGTSNMRNHLRDVHKHINFQQNDTQTNRLRQHHEVLSQCIWLAHWHLWSDGMRRPTDIYLDVIGNSLFGVQIRQTPMHLPGRK